MVREHISELSSGITDSVENKVAVASQVLSIAEIQEKTRLILDEIVTYSDRQGVFNYPIQILSEDPQLANTITPDTLSRGSDEFIEASTSPDNTQLSQLVAKITLSQPIELLFVTKSAARLFNLCIDYGRGGEVIALLPEVLDFYEINVNSLDIIKKLLDAGYKNEIVTRLPDTIDFSTLNEFSRELLVRNLLPEVEELYLPSQLDLGEMNANAYYLIRELPIEKILALLPPTISLESLSKGGKLLLEFVGNDEIIARLPVRIDVHQLSSEGLSLLTNLVHKGYTDKLIFRLKKPFELSNLSYQEASFYSLLIQDGGPSDLRTYFPDTISIANLNNQTGTVINALYRGKVYEDICSVFADVINVATMPRDLAQALVDLNVHGRGLDILNLFPLTIDLIHVNSNAQYVLSQLITDGFAMEIAARLPKKIDIQALSFDGMTIISMLLKQNQYTEVLDYFSESKSIFDLTTTDWDFIKIVSASHPEILKKIDASRQKIDAAQLSFTEKVCPYLFEIIQHFPLKFETLQQRPGGWIVVELNKDDSRTFVYIKMNTKSGNPQILFRNQEGKLPEEKIKMRNSLQAYQAAVKIIPGYISSINYPELQLTESGVISQTKFAGNGFREVYAGYNLDTQLDISKLPQPLQASIEAQKRYILGMLAVHGIDHGHAGEQNMNVRFLLEKDENKIIVFDANIALQHAIKEKMAITPILTLRDWDMAVKDAW